jgi:protein-S-isoprenylcysteine O-methyltransferase Ste14
LGGEHFLSPVQTFALEELKMHLLNGQLLGIAILFLLGMLVTVKRLATGAIFDKPKGNLLIQLVNVFNLFFLLVVNPLAAILLINGSLASIDLAHVTIDLPWLLLVMETVGLGLYVIGFILMAWALVTLGRNYQLGGSAPRSDDKLIIVGPYKLVRHPMYTAALSISLGLACLIQSWVFFGVFCIYLALILPLIPLEEDGLRKAYGEPYAVYQNKTSKLVPLLY